MYKMMYIIPKEAMVLGQRLEELTTEFIMLSHKSKVFQNVDVPVES